MVSRCPRRISPWRRRHCSSSRRLNASQPGKARQRHHEVAPGKATRPSTAPLSFPLARAPVTIAHKVMRQETAEEPRPPARPVRQNARHQAAVVVVENRLRNPAEEGEGMHMPVDPRLGRRRRVGPHIAGVAVRQIEDEEVRLARHTPDHRTRLAEVRLPMARRMDQRHEHLPPPTVVLAHIVLHDRVAAAEPVLGAKPVEDTLGRVALLAGLVGIVLQPLVDDLGEPVQLRAPNRCRPSIAQEAPKSTASSSRSRAKSQNDAPPHARSSRPGRPRRTFR